ncbi:MAG: c-type cytochrome biogenesis protein CcmI [Lysobacterales bacterium]|nr:MAG: c-type cytochrome biogenesis protein CcmI [Xanthomonadales bacterium]
MSLAYGLFGALILIAAAFLLMPLLRAAPDTARRRRALEHARAAGVLDEAEYQLKSQALAAERGTDGDPPRPWLAVSLFATLSIAAVLIYPGPPDESAMRGAQDVGPARTMPDLLAATAQLAARLERDPSDLAGWVLLGRSYRALERFAEAREALARAYALAPEHPDLMVEYAEALALAAPGRMIEGEAMALIERALLLAPDHPRALWLRGIAHRQAGRNEQAVADWERLLTSQSLDPGVRSEIERLIAEARGRSSAQPQTEAPSAPVAAGSVTVLVELDDSLRNRARPEDTVFVFARPAEGGRMPLAIRRLRVADLPAEVRLDAGDAMMPELSLDRFDRVAVGARVSRSGLAQPQSGDLEGLTGPVSTRSGERVRLKIDRVLP